MALTDLDLERIKGVVIGAKQELLQELAKKADKTDVDRMESRLVTCIGLLERVTNDRLDQLETRVTRLERASAP